MSFYEILGIEKTASESEIKKAYRALSLKYHPDRNPSDEAADKIRVINEAYETLSDVGKKNRYDAEQSGNFRHMASMDEFVDINNIFSMLFGQGGPGQGGMPGQGGPGHGFPGMGPEIRIFHGGQGFPGMPGFPGFPGQGFPGQGFPGQGFPRMLQKPPPITKNVAISLEQAYQGCSLPLEIERWIVVGDIKCNELETIYVTIPPGIDDNEMIIMRDRGNALNDTIKGDIKIGIQIQNTSAFKRHGIDLLYKRSITLKEALCGFAFELVHLNGQTYFLNNNTNRTVIHPNYKKTIPLLGMKREESTGNLIIEFDVVFPDALSNEQVAQISAALMLS